MRPGLQELAQSESTVKEDVLTPREKQIAMAYADGDSYHRIADRLFIAPSTVRTHLAAIYRKLGVSSKIELRKVLENDSSRDISQGDQAALVSELALSLEEAISHRRALGEVLKIINRSQGDIDKVMAAVLGHALELCDAEFGILFEYAPISGYEAKFSKGIPQSLGEWLTEQGAFHVDPLTGLGRISADREFVNVVDVRAEEIFRSGDPLRYATAELGGARSFAAVPMLAGDRLLGAFTIYRQHVRPFDSRNLEVAQIFADQSVIAIENARLIKELSPKS